MIENGGIHLSIFDMDGTLFTSNIDWKEVKNRLQVKGSSILEKLYGGEQTDAEGLQYLEEIEHQNTMQCEPVTGAPDFVKEIRGRGIPTALVTNNSRRNTDYLLNKFNIDFDITISREEKMWKPESTAFKFILNKYRISPNRTISVGDSDFDVTASFNAGISDIYIIQNSNIRGDYPVNIRYFQDYIHLDKIIFGS